MSKMLDGLIRLLSLEPIEENLFRGQSVDLGWGRVYGGQVLGQALSAAFQTVPDDRHIHSMHAYFLLPGDVSRPVVYDVDRIRDGSSFTTRRVVAIQNGRAILNLSASFHKEESGFEHADPMPEAPDPESLPDDREKYAEFLDRLPKFLRERALGNNPFQTRTVEAIDDPIAPEPAPPERMYWLKTVAPLSDGLPLHQYLLAYASDNAFLTTALKPHGVTWLSPGMQMASLDHAMWFHRPFRLDDWLLYVIDSPVAVGARAVVRGKFFNRAGELVATTVQEGLVRHHTP